MSKKQYIKRVGRYSDADLKQVADKILMFVQRDAADFTAYGIALPDLNDYAARLAVFAYFPQDADLAGRQMIATQRKTSCRKDLITIMQYFFAVAKFCFSSNPAILAAFGAPDITKQSAEELIRTARSIATTAQDYLPQLTAAGLTAQHLHTLAAANTAFDAAVSAQHIAISDRTIIKEQRIAAANDIYALISKLAAAGKLVWRETNPAKYKDYILY